MGVNTVQSHYSKSITQSLTPLTNWPVKSRLPAATNHVAEKPDQLHDGVRKQPQDVDIMSILRRVFHTRWDWGLGHPHPRSSCRAAILAAMFSQALLCSDTLCTTTGDGLAMLIT